MKGAITIWAILGLASAVVGASHNSSVVSIPHAYTHLLPDGFIGNLNYTFVNGTHVPGNSSINQLLGEASRAPFISFDQEFLDILGENPDVKLVEYKKDDKFAFEFGVWVPERHEIWFTSSVEQPNIQLYSLNLHTNKVNPLAGLSRPIVNPNGGYYFEGKVYLGTIASNETHRAGVYSIDVKTLEVETVVNSYFGAPFSCVDDLVWAKRGNDRYLYFSDLDVSWVLYKSPPESQLPVNLWRWDPQDETLLPVISRNEIQPNGVRVSPDMKTLYVTDGSAVYFKQGRDAAPAGPSVASWLGPYIYKYDLDDEMFPVNRRVFGLARRLIPDGLHCDDKGRVWTGEGEGVVVRSPRGKVLGIFNVMYFLEDKNSLLGAIANFALAGDTLVIEAGTKLWTVKLGQTVVSRNSSIVN